MTRTEEHLELRLGNIRGMVCTLGGAIVRLEDRTGPLISPPTAATCRPDEFRGVVLAPWPNRTSPAYEFGDTSYQLEVSEPSTGAALHGLVAHRTWNVTAREPHRIEMQTSLNGEPGYPFTIDLKVSYELRSGGMSARIIAVNAGDRAAPIGLGAHPYLAAGCAVDDTVLGLPAGLVRVVPDDGDARLVPVEDTPYDFRGGRTIGAAKLDHAFTELSRSGDGSALTSLSCTGRTVSLVAGSTVDWLMVFTSDTLRDHARRAGIAIEPMTCGPGALASGEGLTVLEPGAATQLTWSILATTGPHR